MWLHVIVPATASPATTNELPVMNVIVPEITFPVFVVTDSVVPLT
jgi:hypothetical protein